MPDEPKTSVAKPSDNLMRSVGRSGLKRRSGKVEEEWLRQLKGKRLFKQLTEMLDSHAVGAVAYALETLIGQVEWRAEPAGEEEVHLQAAEFLEECMADVRGGWGSVIDEASSALWYGWDWQEVVYKRRVGPDEEDPTKRSKYSDNRIGWRKIEGRAQDTLEKWEWDEETDELIGMWQREMGQAPVFIPLSKSLHVRTKMSKNNPEGRSLLRAAYAAWYRMKNVETIEAIGIERDLAGYPVARVPKEFLMDGATSDQTALIQELEKQIQEIRRDEREGSILPNREDGFDLELLTTGGKRQFDTGAVVTRYKRDIMMTMLAEVIMLGMDQVGSYALADSKTNMLAMSLSAFIEKMRQAMNEQLVEPLFKLNPEFPREVWPTLEAGDIEVPDLGAFAEFLSKLIMSGALTPDAAIERRVREMAGLPQPADDEMMEPEEPGEGQQEPAQETPGAPGPARPAESAPEAVDPQTALNGAQVKSMVEIILSVSTGQLPRQTGVEIIAAAFPITLEEADRIMGEVGKGFEARQETPPTVPPTGPPAVPPTGPSGGTEE